MTVSSAKWFDLSGHDAKLERLDTDGFGHYKLMLELPASRLDPLLPADERRSITADLADMGWRMEAVGTDRYLLTNYTPLNRKTEIVAALRPFFSEQEIDASHVSVHALTQGERVQGLQARQLITQAELRTDIEGVAPEDFDRIAGSVRRAQEMRAERMQRQASVLFDGRGRALFEHLTDAVITRQGWAEAEAAFVVHQQMRVAVQAPKSVHAVRLTDLAKALDAGAETEIGSGTDYALGRVASTAEEWDDLRQVVLGSEELRESVEKFESGDGGALARIRDVVMDDTGRFGPEIMDRVEITVPGDEAFVFYKERLPFMVIRDSSVPTRTLVQNMAAVDAALDVVAAELEIPRDSLIPKQRSVPVRFSYDAVSGDGAAIGRMHSIGASTGGGDDGEEDRAALTMNLSVMKGRSFIHELGHLIDSGNRLTDEERHAILSKSGVLAKAREAVDRQFPEGGQFAEYLLDEAEVFARAFDAHMVNAVRARGDVGLKELGGLHTTQGFDRAGPYGNLERSTAFINELKDVLALRREARHEARHRTGAEAASGVSMQMG
jgi:hypothetical protein